MISRIESSVADKLAAKVFSKMARQKQIREKKILEIGLDFEKVEGLWRKAELDSNFDSEQIRDFNFLHKSLIFRHE